MKDPYIWVVDDVIPKQRCKEIIDKFNADKSPDKKKGSIGRGVDLLHKNSTDLLISGKDNWTDIDNYFRNLVNKLMQKYSNYITLTFNSFTAFTTGENMTVLTPLGDNPYDLGYQIQRTEVGEGYVWHNDYDKGRVLTFIIYLNSVDEGWTQFWNGDQVSPQTGRCLMFPATWSYLHQGYPPKQTKYIMTGWIHHDLNLY